jgi:hypothetical protein
MYFDEGINHYGQISPEEPRLGPDGSIYVQTLACGLERITGIDTNAPKSQLVYLFAASYCGVPTIVGHYLLQSVSYLHSVIVLDISNGAKLLEVSRLKIDDNFYPHWTGWDAKTHRVVVTTGGTGDPAFTCSSLIRQAVLSLWTTLSAMPTASQVLIFPTGLGRMVGRAPACLTELCSRAET